MVETVWGKEEKAPAIFIIHTAEEEQIELFVWEHHLEVDGVCYEAAEDVCALLVEFYREYT